MHVYYGLIEELPGGTPVSIGWFSPLNEPIVASARLKFLQTASQLSFFWSESQQFPETVTESRWHQAWSEPVRVRPGLRHHLQQFQPYEETQQFPETVTESRWHQAWSEPVRIKPWLTAASIADNHYLELNPLPIIQVPSWFNALSDPVRTRWFAAALQQFQPYNETQQFPETVTEDRWHQPWSEPSVKAKPWLTAAQQHFFEFDSVPFIKIDWFNGLSEPVRTRWFAASQQQFQPYNETQQFPETVTEDRWHQPWSEPVRAKPNTGKLTAPDAFVALQTAVAPVGFHSVWSDPVQYSTPWKTGDASAGFIAIQGSVTEDMWHQGWATPISIKSLFVQLQQVSTGPFVTTTPTTPSVDGWVTQLSDPVRVKPAVAWQQYLAQAEASPFTESVSEDKWHQQWSEPVRLKVGLAAYLQQAIAFDPAIITASTTPVDGWVTQLSEPIVKGKIGLAAAQQQALAEVLVPSLVTPFLSLAWHIQLAEPVRQRPALGAGLNPDQSEAINPANVTPFIGLGWYLPLSDNGRRAPQFSAMLPIDANFNPNPIPNPPVFGVFAVSGGDVNDRFPVNGLSYTYSPMSHRTN